MAHPTARFEGAIHTLIADEPIKRRLGRAFSEHLEDLDEDDLPANLRVLFSELRDALHRVAPMGKGTRVSASVQKMSFNEACAHAATIVKLYVELARYGERSEHLKVVKNDKETPRFLMSNS